MDIVLRPKSELEQCREQMATAQTGKNEPKRKRLWIDPVRFLAFIDAWTLAHWACTTAMLWYDRLLFFVNQWRRLRAPRTAVERCFAYLKRYHGLKYFQVKGLAAVYQHALLVHFRMRCPCAALSRCSERRSDSAPAAGHHTYYVGTNKVNTVRLTTLCQIHLKQYGRGCHRGHQEGHEPKVYSFLHGDTFPSLASCATAPWVRCLGHWSSCRPPHR